MTDIRQYYREQFNAAQASLPGYDLPWLMQKRQAAMDIFVEKGLPTRKDEDWKYTSVAAIEAQIFTVEKSEHVFHNISLAPFMINDTECHTLVFIDGYYQPQLSHFQDLPSGVILTNLASALQQYPDMLAPHLAVYADPQAHGFSALNTALMSDGLFVYVPEHRVVKHPIHVIFLGKMNNAFNNMRNVIIAEDSSQVTLVETFIGLTSDRYLNNSITEVAAGRNTVIGHYKLQQEGGQGCHIGTLQCHQRKASTIDAYSFSLGGNLVRSDTNVELAAEQASCSLHGLYMGKARQHIDHHTCIDHAKPHGTSREYYKGILTDRSHAVFNGKVIVAPNAQKTDAWQYNKNLLLSKRAEVDTKPQLEIYADDVKCSHGATVGQLDENALFYLRSRGIAEENARDLLIHAFAFDVIESVKLAALKTKLGQLFAAYI